jgi:putative ABC transport system permease protein
VTRTRRYAAPVLFVSLRDLQWRLRRFIIGVLATGLVFAIALLISGINASFQNEAKRAVKSFNADQWLVSKDSLGAFNTATPLDNGPGIAAEVARDPGVRGADPVLIFPFTVTEPSIRDLNVIGVVPKGVGAPVVIEGRALARGGDMVADKSAGLKIGDSLRLHGITLHVVGRTHGISYNAGTPTVFVTFDDAQHLFFPGGKKGDLVRQFTKGEASAIVLRGKVTKPPADLGVRTNAAILSDLRRPLKKATETISFLRFLLWIIAAGIIGSVLYLQAIERTRDFAVFKATGVSSRTLLFGITLQAILLAACAALAALAIAWALGPTMTLRIEVPPSAYLALPIVAIAVGLIASLFGLRRAVTVDPAVAFGGA